MSKFFSASGNSEFLQGMLLLYATSFIVLREREIASAPLNVDSLECAVVAQTLRVEQEPCTSLSHTELSIISCLKTESN